MIFAAGLGTRLRPLTDTMPKALVRVGGEPLLWHVVMKLKAAGYERIVVNVHHFAQQIIDYLQACQNFGLDIRISDETGGLLETGGGIRKARPLFASDEPVLIHNVDILSNVDLGELTCPGHADALLLVSPRVTKRYLLLDESSRLVGWMNKETGEVKSPHQELHYSQMLAFSGIHIIHPALLSLMDDWPERFPIIDFYLHHCDDTDIRCVVKDDLRLLDVGKLDSLGEAEDFIKTTIFTNQTN